MDASKSSQINEFIKKIHDTQNDKIMKTCTFTETEDFYKFVEDNLKGSLEVTSLIFAYPDEIIKEVGWLFRILARIVLSNF